MPRNCSTRQGGSISSREIKSKPFFWNESTGRKYDVRKDNSDIYFASQLEFCCYQELAKNDIDFVYQFKLPIMGKSKNFSPKMKAFDFKLVGAKTILECKGQWINKQAHRASKALFLNECQLAELAGFQIIIVANLGPGGSGRPFKIGPYTAIDFRGIHGLHLTERQFQW